MTLLETEKFLDGFAKISADFNDTEGNMSDAIKMMQSVNKMLDKIEKMGFDNGYNVGLNELDLNK